MIFKDREDAALKLANKLYHYKDQNDTIILALPRGGVVTGEVLSRKLHLPMDVAMVKKLGHPGNPEFAVGSVTLQGFHIDQKDMVSEEYVKEETKKIQELLKQRYRKYKGDTPPFDLKGKTVIITDDGVATGNTMISTILSIRANDVQKMVAAVPVAPPQSLHHIKQEVNEVVCVHTTEDFFAIGQFYQNFDQVDDDTVIEKLNQTHSIE
ncbi:MAG: phosphoribosyltransferase [Bacteroidota bacterium]